MESSLSKTVPPLVSLSPISRSAGRPLSIIRPLSKNKSRRSEHQLSSGLCYCTALFSAIFQLYSWPCYCTSLFPTIQLYSQPRYCTALFLAMLLFSIIPAISSFIPAVFDYLWIIALITINVSYDNTGIVYTGVWDQRVLGWQRLYLMAQERVEMPGRAGGLPSSPILTGLSWTTANKWLLFWRWWITCKQQTNDCYWLRWITREQQTNGWE